MREEQATNALMKEILSLLRSIRGLLKCLTDAEVRDHTKSLVNAVLPILLKKMARLPIGEDREIVEQTIEKTFQGAKFRERIDEAIRDVEEHSRAKQKKARDPKPRNTTRDEEIVRLHDEKGLSFGQIGRRLKTTNPAWVGPDGDHLTYDSVRKAYHRAKVRSDK